MFADLYEAASKILNNLKIAALSPETKKTLREWGISEVADMVGRTSQTLRNLEDSEKIPKARQVKNGRKLERRYNLKEINHIRKLLGTKPEKPKEADPAILSFTNFKGGAGKTTEAIAAAQGLSLKGYRVLLVDLDSQGSATHAMGFNPDEDFDSEQTSLNILIDEDSDIHKVIQKTYWDGLDLVPANLGLYNAELIIPTQLMDYSLKTGKSLPFYNYLNASLESIYSDYDIIIIDCPPSLGFITMNALYAANAIMVEVPPVIVDFASTKQFFKMVSEVLERLPDKSYAFIRLLLTKFNNRTSAQELHALLKQYFGQYVMSNNMIETEVIPKASANMQTLYEIEKYDGSKKTYTRAMQYAEKVNEEIEGLVKRMWLKQTQQTQQTNTQIQETINGDLIHGE